MARVGEQHGLAHDLPDALEVLEEARQTLDFDNRWRGKDGKPLDDKPVQCLKCDTVFRSIGKQNRICGPCIEANKEIAGCLELGHYSDLLNTLTTAGRRSNGVNYLGE